MKSFSPFQIANVPVGGPTPFFILGPCALETEPFAWEMARSLKEIADRTGIPFIFKASFDKANRTSVNSFRGPGIEEGCRILGVHVPACSVTERFITRCPIVECLRHAWLSCGEGVWWSTT